VSADGHFEGRLTSKRESKAGIFITIEVQPTDYIEALANLRVGASLVIGWAEVVNTKVEPIEVVTNPDNWLPEKPLKPRQKFDELKPSAQAGIRCSDADYSTFLMDTFPDIAAEHHDAAGVVRELCGITSRAELNSNKDAAFVWNETEAKYQAWLVEQRYKDLIR
jgi:hypothetical protein